MDLDEILFTKVARFFRNRKKSQSLPHEIRLDDIQPRLLLIARAFTGKPVEIFPAEREGGHKHHNFFLPQRFSLFNTQEENLAFYFYRIVYLTIQLEITPDLINKSKSNPSPEDIANVVLSEMERQYPLAHSLYQILQRQILQLDANSTTSQLFWLYGRIMVNEDDAIMDDELPEAGILHPKTNTPVTTVKAKAVEEIRSIAVDKKQQEDYVLTHNFEKVETAEEFSGVWRDFDGADDMEDHQDALDELNMKFTVRVNDTTHSVYQADFIENAHIAESKEQESEGACVLYPEWDSKKRRYRENFCKVFPHQQLSTDASYYFKTLKSNHTTLNGLRKMVTHLNNKMGQQRRQTDGNEFDLDALTDLYTDVHSGHTPSENIYLSNRKLEKDLSILLLLDSSLSSDSYVEGNRVLDIEKEVSILFGEILNEFHIDFSVASFYSKTRNYLHYLNLKAFDEPWNQAKLKIGAAEPLGYTRIGAALRHAGTNIRNRPGRNKWVILLSDGKPNDYDQYEGKHGINDVKQALRELHAEQINSFAFAIEARARYYLPQMFGQNHYQILSHPSSLLESMVLLFEKIKYQA